MTQQIPSLDDVDSTNVRFVVVRPGENTAAIVTAWVSESNLKNERKFLERLTTALTEWVKTTADGKEAWEYSSYDFNVGDLATSLADNSLVDMLKKYGIYNMDVDAGDISSQTWLFDEVLVNAEDLE